MTTRHIDRGGKLAIGHRFRTGGSNVMELGNFSVSLAVKDIEALKAFYEKFGFKMETRSWLTSTYEVEGPAGDCRTGDALQGRRTRAGLRAGGVIAAWSRGGEWFCKTTGDGVPWS